MIAWRAPAPFRVVCLVTTRRCVGAFVLALLVGFSSPAQAQSPTSPPPTVAPDSAIAVVHGAMLATLVAGDTAAVSRWWCPDYVAVASNGFAAGLDTLRLQLARGSALRHLRTEPRTPLRVAVVSDSQAITMGEYWLGYDAGGRMLEAPFALTYEFRRRRGGWCAFRGRSGYTRLGERRVRQP